ncbi:DUF2512 family protein [Peribacillus sp. SCS-155]|uniref:DUF2512 family protein n=1 Tax=Peribacillus sedimenti TaxID=3115297 RepID=UPI003905F18D
MNHIKAIVIKFVMIALIVSLVFSGIFDAELSESLLLSAVVTLLAYAIGDNIVFRNSDRDSEYTRRNLIATIADIGLSFFTLWITGEIILENTDNIVIASLISSLLIGAGEWFYHKYLDNHVFPEKSPHA